MFSKLVFSAYALGRLIRCRECCATGAKGEKSTDDEKHQEAKEQLSTPVNPEDIRAPSSIREYNNLVK